MQDPFQTPPPLKQGDAIAIISPATEVKPHWIRGAVAELERRGYRPAVMPHAYGPRHGTYAASDANRLADLREAILDPDIKAILCARGGYGCVHLLSRELQAAVADHPKWLIGFSDVSALHALWLHAGVRSIHASMARQLTLFDLYSQKPDIIEAVGNDAPSEAELPLLRKCTDELFSILEGHPAATSFLNEGRVLIPGAASGIIAGGNLAVLNGLAGTPWDILTPDFLRGKVLFLEDVGEKIYQVERMLKRLQLAGVFDATAAVIFGQFTDYPSDRNFPSMEAMVETRFREWGISCPTRIDVPIGHTPVNHPIEEGSMVNAEG